MNDLWEFYLSKTWVEPFLGWSILIFIIFSVVLYLLIIKSRSQKLKAQHLTSQYDVIIARFLFAVIFDNLPFDELKSDPDYKLLTDNKSFRSQTIASLINLHQNYEGVYAKKLERFYYESGLIKVSFKNMKSRKWEVVCQAVRELAEMNVTKAFEPIVKISRTNNKTLKVVALNACIKLNGTKGLTHLIDHKDPIDEWIQINIISAIKMYDSADVNGVELLLESQNQTVVSLGLKIISTLKLSDKAEDVTRLAANTAHSQIKSEAQNVLNTLSLPF